MMNPLNPPILSRHDVPTRMLPKHVVSAALDLCHITGQQAFVGPLVSLSRLERAVEEGRRQYLYASPPPAKLRPSLDVIGPYLGIYW